MALREQVIGAGRRPASSVRTPFPLYWVVSQLSEMTTTAEVTLDSFGASVLIDATIIRPIIVPALMFLFDKANWWTPRWLDRILHRLDPELATPAAQRALAGARSPPTIDNTPRHAEPRAV
jgi:hypothetical protein